MPQFVSEVEVCVVAIQCKGMPESFKTFVWLFMIILCDDLDCLMLVLDNDL